MKRFVAVLLLIVALVAPLPFLTRTHEPAPQRVTGLPWQVEPLPGGGSRVFGLVLGETTLGAARERLGPELEVGIIAAGGETGALEAYHGRYTAGVLTGKLVLGTRLSPQALEAMKGRAVHREPTATGAWRYRLAPQDLERAWAAPVEHVTFIPTVQLEPEVVRQRFGDPAQRVTPPGDRREHWLYPDLGLDLIVDPDGKEVLQYVAPRDFNRLRRPLSSSRIAPPA